MVIDSTALNRQPAHDPASSVVMQASVANIDSVVVAGEWRKRRGKLLTRGLLQMRARLRELGERILYGMTLHKGAA